MPNNWISYSDYLGLTGDETQRLEEEAMQRAQSAEGEASQALRQAQRQAAQSGGELTGTMSYNDYLAAKQRVASIYSADKFGNDFRRRAASGAQPTGDDAQARLQGQEAQSAATLRQGVETANQYRAAAQPMNDRLAESQRLVQGRDAAKNARNAAHMRDPGDWQRQRTTGNGPQYANQQEAMDALYDYQQGKKAGI